MNIHPIFVHFPVALLTVYSIMEFVRFGFVMRRPYWFYIKAVVLMLGGLGALAALYTGDFAEAAVRQGDFNVAVLNFRQVLSTHQNFADASTAIFGILSASYLILWFDRDNFGNWLERKFKLRNFWLLLVKIAHFFAETKFAILMALTGLICITITGALGGAMVYGPNVDPVVKFLYSIVIGN